MPLVVLCGYPSSGKTRIGKDLLTQLQQYCESIQAPITKYHIINDESLKLSRSLSYENANEEKKARGAMISAVERYLARDTLVIADGMNYIKGFRYQLYCIARGIGTPHCVVHCGTPINLTREWNASRSDDKYETEIFENLITRFEEPDSRNRWDAPLFTILYDDEVDRFIKPIVDAVVLRKPPPPNMSTLVKPLSANNALYEIEKTTQDIISAILASQNEGLGATEITVPKANIKVQLSSPRTLTMAELRRTRKAFLTVNKMVAQAADVSKIADNFVQFLNAQL